METTTNEPHASAPGDALVRELLWVHGVLRRDLETVRRLAADVLAGASPEQIRSEITTLESTSPLWRMRVNCLYYCRFVHTHHSLEDRHLFPALRRANPALGPVVDKLEADHHQVADYCDEVAAAADGIVAEDTTAGRQRIVDALTELSDHLLAHLAFEEEHVTPTLREWDRWPFD